MKFAHAFTEQLQGNEYPSEWLNAAIRYRHLKKCIKKVQRELAELGLTADMLKMLAKEKGVGSEPATVIANPGEYPSDVEGNILLKRRGSYDSRISDSSAGSSSVGTEDFDEEEWLRKSQASEEPPKQAVTFSYWFDGPSILPLNLMFHIKYPSLLFADSQGERHGCLNKTILDVTTNHCYKSLTNLHP